MQPTPTKTWAYDVLGLPEWAEKEYIRRAWKDLSRKHHPNCGGDPDHFRNIQQAYETLIFTT